MFSASRYVLEHVSGSDYRYRFRLQIGKSPTSCLIFDSERSLRCCWYTND